jgi:hypothetical protein
VLDGGRDAAFLVARRDDDRQESEWRVAGHGWREEAKRPKDERLRVEEVDEGKRWEGGEAWGAELGAWSMEKQRGHSSQATVSVDFRSVSQCSAVSWQGEERGMRAET